MASSKKARDPLDRYYTNDALALKIGQLAREMAPDARTFLEPSSGGGSFLRAMREAWNLQDGLRIELPAGACMPQSGGWAIHAVDLDPGAREAACAQGAQFWQGGFLGFHSAPADGYDCILSNPPFAEPPPPGKERGKPIACDHVAHALGMLAVGGVMACLIRQSFLATKERAKLFARYCPARVDILVERPSFTADGATDQHEYCVIYWQRAARTLFRPKGTTVLDWMNWK